MSDVEKKVVFAVSPTGTGDGIPVVLIGIPAGAWEHMKDGKTSDFDLSRIGIPVKFMFFGAASHADAMKTLEAAAAATGTALLDERRRDFSIKPGPATSKGGK